MEEVPPLNITGNTELDSPGCIDIWDFDDGEVYLKSEVILLHSGKFRRLGLKMDPQGNMFPLWTLPSLQSMVYFDKNYSDYEEQFRGMAYEGGVLDEGGSRSNTYYHVLRSKSRLKIIPFTIFGTFWGGFDFILSIQNARLITRLMDAYKDENEVEIESITEELCKFSPSHFKATFPSEGRTGIIFGDSWPYIKSISRGSSWHPSPASKMEGLRKGLKLESINSYSVDGKSFDEVKHLAMQRPLNLIFKNEDQLLEYWERSSLDFSDPTLTEGKSILEILKLKLYDYPTMEYPGSNEHLDIKKWLPIYLRLKLKHDIANPFEEVNEEGSNTSNKIMDFTNEVRQTYPDYDGMSNYREIILFNWNNVLDYLHVYEDNRMIAECSGGRDVSTLVHAEPVAHPSGGARYGRRRRRFPNKKRSSSKRRRKSTSRRGRKSTARRGRKSTARRGRKSTARRGRNAVRRKI